MSAYYLLVKNLLSYFTCKKIYYQKRKKFYIQINISNKYINNKVKIFMIYIFLYYKNLKTIQIKQILL